MKIIKRRRKIFFEAKKNSEASEKNVNAINIDGERERDAMAVKARFCLSNNV